MGASLPVISHRIARSRKPRSLPQISAWLLLPIIFCMRPAGAFAAVSVTISPSSVNLPIGGSQQFSATVTGATDTSVTWTIEENASGGTISSAGLYVAPGAVGVYHVVATSNADSSQKAIATVALPGFIQTGLINPDPCTATLLSNGKVLYTGGGLPSQGFAASPAEIYTPATATSTATGSMTILRCSETATLLPNGKVLLAGGQTSGGATATAELYDPVAGTFTATGNMTAAREGHTATLLPDGTVLIAGGAGNCGGSSCSLNSAEVYNPGSGSFGPTSGKMTAPFSTGASILLNSGNVLILGGGNTFAELYDPSTGLFTETGALIHPRVSFTATLLPDGTVLIAGGASGAMMIGPAEIYDPFSNTFSATGNLNLPREFHTATLLGSGKVLIAGGTASPNTAELYDPGSRTFVLTDTLEETRWSPTATALPNGTVLIAGGNFNQRLSSIETYDPNAGTFSSQSVFLKVTRTGHATTQLADGRLLLTGGEDESFHVNSSAEIFDIVSGQFSLTEPMIQARYGHTATLLSDGSVLIVGGYGDKNGTQIVSTAELYNPATGAFGLAPSSPNLPRAYHTATLLKGGKVLIAGGQIAGQQTTSSVELYDPIAGSFTLAGNMDAPRYSHTATLLNDGRVLIAEGVSGNGPAGKQVAPDDVYDPTNGQFTPVGPTGPLQNFTVIPFDSVLLANGQVLANNKTIFDPASNTLSGINSPVNLDAILQDYKFALLPNNQVFATSNSYPTYLFDPFSETYTASASLQYFRISPTLKLLPNGQVLVAGGAGVAQVEFYVPPVAISVSAPSAPTLSALNPSSAVAGGAGFTLLVVGSNFTANSAVNFNAAARQTTFLSTSQLQIAVTAADIAVPGSATITVTNPSSGAGEGVTSNPLTLTILAANIQPIVGGLSPASTTAGGPAFTLIVTGNNFTPNSFVTINGNPVTTTYVSGTELNAAIPASAIAVAGTPLVSVSNPGSNPSAIITFTVNNPVPQESLLTPSNAAAGSPPLLLDVVGTSFNASSQILVNGTALSTTFVSPTLLQATLPASDLAQGGTLNISVSNPLPGGGTASPLQFTVVDFSISSPTSSTTVNAGLPATFSLTVAPSGGTFSNSITFAASGVPPKATATFSPSNGVIPGADPQPVTLTISTTAHSTSEVVGPDGTAPSGQWFLFVGMAMAFAGLALSRSGLRRARFAPQILIALMLVAAAGLVACGGGGYAAPSAPQLNLTTGTPAGTYPITVTATSGGVAHSATVTLTVM